MTDYDILRHSNAEITGCKWLFRDVTNHAICQGRDGAELLLAAIKTSLRFRSLFKIVYALLIYHVLTKLCRKILVPLVLIIHFIADERSFIKDQAERSGFGLPSFPGV